MHSSQDVYNGGITKLDSLTNRSGAGQMTTRLPPPLLHTQVCARYRVLSALPPPIPPPPPFAVALIMATHCCRSPTYCTPNNPSCAIGSYPGVRQCTGFRSANPCNGNHAVLWVYPGFRCAPVQWCASAMGFRCVPVQWNYLPAMRIPFCVPVLWGSAVHQCNGITRGSGLCASQFYRIPGVLLCAS